MTQIKCIIVVLALLSMAGCHRNESTRSVSHRTETSKTQESNVTTPDTDVMDQGNQSQTTHIHEESSKTEESRN